MFEDSTFESMGRIRTRSRGWMLATFALNGSILLALILIPLIYPQALPRMAIPMLMQAPSTPPEAPKPQPIPAGAVVVRPRFDLSTFTAPSQIPHTISTPDTREVLIAPIDPNGLGGGGNGPGNPDGVFNGQRSVRVVEARPRGPANVSSGIMQGLLLQEITPAYPPIAKAARVEGTVVLQAVISKTGTIENLRVVSGPAMLQQAAIDAVEQWIYRPYLLDGAPVEVETTVNVNFRLN